MRRPSYLKADRRPTWTALTTEALRRIDDFATLEQLMTLTGANGNQMRATLHWLKRAGVVEAMETDGRLWWYLTGEDKRIREVPERTEEPKGNRSRASKKPWHNEE